MPVTLDGSASSDSDGTIASYNWTGNPNPADVMSPTVTLSEGTHTFTLSVTDNEGSNSTPDTVTVSVSSGTGGGEPSQEIAQALIDDFDTGDTDDNGTLSFSEAQALFAALTLAEFNALDINGDGELSQPELTAAGATPPTTGGGGCFGKSNSPKIFTDLKDFFGDLFLLGLLTVVLVAWRGFGVRTDRLP